MDAMILNISLICADASLNALEDALRRYVKPVVAATEHLWLKLKEVQGQIPPPDEPQSIALQCRFANMQQLSAFRNGDFALALKQLSAALPPQQCMIFETILESAEI